MTSIMSKSQAVEPARRRLGAAAVAVAAVLGLSACAGTTGGAAPDLSATGQGAPLPVATADRVLERGDAALAAGGLEDARAHYGIVLSRDPGNTRAALGLAEVALAAGETAKARDAFAALAANPEVAPSVTARAHQGVGLSWLKEGQTEKALPALEDAVAADDGLWRAWNALGAAHDRRQNWDAAVAAYDKAIALAPEEAGPVNNLGFSLILQGRHQDAARHLVRAAHLARDMDMPRVNLRLALAWQGRYDDAVAGATPAELPAVLNNVGYVALLKGDHADAESLLVRSLEASPSYFEAARLNLDHLRTVAPAGGGA
ncbi:tetratricopeptide repeat protein [Caenispirillum salinarum]|uniref:tetratricopeptide repeat protein n=1 Tax=Caenispirillum salinarum TaxID=859058 RepID=UPI00384DF73F